MQITNADKHRILMAMAKRQPGRPVVAQPELRNNGYKDQNGQYQVTELKPWHERIVDWMIMNPEGKIVDVARAFGVTPQWVGQLTKTEAFKSYYTMRMEAHRDLIDEEIIRKMQGVAVAGLEETHKNIQKGELAQRDITEATTLALKSLGYGATGGVNVSVKNGEGNQLVQIGVSPQVIERARQAYEAKSQEGLQAQAAAEDYKRVTAALDVGYEGLPQVEDAEVIEGQDDEA